MMNEILSKLILLFESKDYKKLVFYLLLLPMTVVPSFTYIFFFENGIFHDFEFAKLLMLILVSNFIFIFVLLLFGLFKESELSLPLKKQLSLEKDNLLKLKSKKIGRASCRERV